MIEEADETFSPTFTNDVTHDVTIRAFSLIHGRKHCLLHDYGSEGRGFESSRARHRENSSNDAISADFEPFLLVVRQNV